MSERSSAQANTPTSANMQYGYPSHFDLINMQPIQNPTDMYSYYTTNVYPPFNTFDEHSQWATADTPGNVPPPGPMPFHQMYTPSPLDMPRAPFEYPPAPHAYPHYLPSFTPSTFPAPPSTGTSAFDISWSHHSLSMQPMPVAAPQQQMTPIGGGLTSTKKPSAYDEYPAGGVGDMLAQHMNSVDLGGNAANDDTHHNYDNGTNDPTNMLAAKEQQQQQQQQQQYQSTSSNLSLSSTRPTQAPASSSSNGPKSYASVVSADSLSSNSNKSTPSVSNVPVRSSIQSSNNEHNPTSSNYAADSNNHPRSNPNFRGNNHQNSMNNYSQQNRNGSAGYNPRYHQPSSASGGFPNWNNNSPTNNRSANNHNHPSSTYYNSGSPNHYDRSYYSQQQTNSSPNNNVNRRANSNYQQNYPSSRTNTNNNNNLSNGNSSNSASGQQASSSNSQDTLDALKRSQQYNPKDFNLSPKGARFFVIKSYSEDDVHRSIKYNIWCSTEKGNKCLDGAFREREGKGPIYLFFSVNASGHFCGMAEMMSPVDYEHKTDIWQRSDKWQGKFEVKWIYVKDVPNQQFRQIRLENNENKPVTNSRDTQEIPYEKGKLMLKTMHMYRDKTSIFDDFEYYESKQAEEGTKKHPNNDYQNNTPRGNNNNPKRQYSSYRTSAMQHEQQHYQQQDNNQHEDEQ